MNNDASFTKQQLLMFQAARRAYKKSLARTLNSFRNGIFPIAPEIIAGNVVLLTGLHLAGVDLTFGIYKAIVSGLNM